MLVLPPKQRSKLYDHARHIFAGLGAQVLNEKDIEGWARGATKKVTAAHS